MTARFISQTEIAAGPAPFETVRRNATASRAGMRDEMRKLMTQGAIDLGPAMLAEARIQRNELIPKVGAPGRAAKPRIPFHSHTWTKCLCTDGAEEGTSFRFELGVATYGNRRMDFGRRTLLLWRSAEVRASESGDEKVELLKQQHTLRCSPVLSPA